MGLYEEFIECGVDGNYADHDEIALDRGAKQVHYDIVDTTRWGQVVEYVYQLGDEYVKVQYEEGSGDSDIDYDPTFSRVKPVVRQTIDYVNLD